MADPFEEENKLMELSSLDNFPEIPNNSNIFKSSILPYSELKKKHWKNVELEEKKKHENIITHNESSLFHSENQITEDLELNFNFNLEDSITSSQEDNDKYYDSFDNPMDLEKSNFQNSYDFINIEIEEDYFRSSLSLRNDIIKNKLPQLCLYRYSSSKYKKI